MVRISFYLNYYKREFSFDLQTAFMPATDGSNVELIISSSLRSEEYRRYTSNIMLTEELRIKEQFYEDFKDVVNSYNKLRMPMTSAVMKQVVLRICNHHVSKYGQLFMADMLMYIDCVLYLMKCVNDLSDSDCQTICTEIAEHVSRAMDSYIVYYDSRMPWQR